MALKTGRVKIFQCEACGEVFDENSPEAKGLQHTGVRMVADGHGGGEPEPYPCGPISERILCDEARIRNETIEECAKVADDYDMPFNALGSQQIAERIRALKEDDKP